MSYYVYILTNVSHSVLYTGFTGDLLQRVEQHKAREIAGFTKRYNVDRLVYYEEHESPEDGITRENQLKAGPRRKKLALVDSFNPTWRDLYHEIVRVTS
ncbi:MAG TPA: GIY-YIG nuclease family protein [Dehalococcoidia bacterium]|nr:GIY-YIG nuclease family protein [Dehalococcoidia bacterium]